MPDSSAGRFCISLLETVLPRKFGGFYTEITKESKLSLSLQAKGVSPKA